MAVENTKIAKNIVTRKVKLIPNSEQKKLFQKCINATRYFYNKAIECINNRYTTRKDELRNTATCIFCLNPKLEGSFCCLDHINKKVPWNVNINLISIRKEIMKSDASLKGTKDEWQCLIPYDTRQLAIKDAVSAYKAAITNRARGNISTFEMGYRSRRNPSQIFWVDDNAIKRTNNKLSIFPTRLGNNKYIRVRKRQLKRLPTVFESDCKIQKYGKDYYLIYTYEDNSEQINHNKNPILSLDPGVRTFQTGYSPSGIVLKYGDDYRNILHKKHEKLDKLRSMRSKTKMHTKKQNLRNRALKIENNIKSIIDNLHNQVASHISRNYNTILLPKFSTSVMQKSNTLVSSTKRDLWTFSHYKFQNKLLGLCKKRGSTLYIVGEEYTTKTCGGCGTIHNIGSAKIYNCSQCNYSLDRDVHGARNILIKHITNCSV